MENNNNNNKEMMVEMRQLLKQLIALLKQMRRYQKAKQPTGYTLYRRDGGRAWNTLTQEEQGVWNTEAKAIREKKNEERGEYGLTNIEDVSK